MLDRDAEPLILREDVIVVESLQPEFVLLLLGSQPSEGSLQLPSLAGQAREELHG